MAVSTTENISTSGGKISLQGNSRNCFGMSEASGRFARSSYKTFAHYKNIYTLKLIYLFMKVLLVV